MMGLHAGRSAVRHFNLMLLERCLEVIVLKHLPEGKVRVKVIVLKDHLPGEPGFTAYRRTLNLNDELIFERIAPLFMLS